MTMASQPQRLPASAKPLLASESLMRSVSGLWLTTANLAEVVSGLPTSGLKAKTSGASGESGSAVAPPSSSSSRAPRPLPPMYCAQHVVRQRHALGGAGRDVDAEVAAVIAEHQLAVGTGSWHEVTRASSSSPPSVLPLPLPAAD